MELQFKERWQHLQAFLEDRFGKMPNMESILFLVGLNEYQGRVPKIKFSKEEKQELMHVGVCAVLEKAGKYKFVALDEDGWPHYEKLEEEQPNDLASQEQLLKENLLIYFGF